MKALLPVVMPWSGAAPGAQPFTLFTDDFEARQAGVAPPAPWKEESYDTGVMIRVDADRAYSGRQAPHVHDPRGAKYRRGYMAIHLKSPLPALTSGMYGRAMVWLDGAPEALPGAPPVHWTLLQGEGRSADDRYNSIYRLGVDATAACKGNDLGGEWRAPPAFDSFYIGLERYADSANDQDLWIDDVTLAQTRVGCPR